MPKSRSSQSVVVGCETYTALSKLTQNKVITPYAVQDHPWSPIWYPSKIRMLLSIGDYNTITLTHSFWMNSQTYESRETSTYIRYPEALRRGFGQTDRRTDGQKDFSNSAV